VLVELGVVERYRAVLEVLEGGAPVTEVPASLGWRGRRCMSGWPAMRRAAWRGSRTGPRGRRRARIRCPRWWRRGSRAYGGSTRGGGRRGSGGCPARILNYAA